MTSRFRSLSASKEATAVDFLVSFSLLHGAEEGVQLDEKIMGRIG